MASKQVSDRKKSSTLVAAAAETHKDAIQDGAERLLKSHLKKGETMPDLRLVATLLARSLGALGDGMSKADDDHERELSDDAEPRDARDKVMLALYSKVVEVGEIIQGMYGHAAVRKCKLDGTTPRDGELLLQHAKTASGLLRTVKFGEPRVKGAKIDGGDFADELDALAKEAKKALGDVAREIREAETTQVKKGATIAAFDAGFSSTAGLLSALLTVAGEKELASRVRPSTRRPGQLEEPEPEPTPTP